MIETMTLATRLILLVAGALLFSLLAGGLLILAGAAQWVQAEVASAAQVAHELVDDRLAEADEEGESSERLTELLRSLEAGYHVHAVYRPADATPTEAPQDAIDASLLSRLLGVHPIVEEIPVRQGGTPVGRIVLVSDPEPEVKTVGRAIEIGLASIALCSLTTLVLVAIGLTRSLRPLGQLAEALSRVGTGDYSGRLASGGPRETALLGRQFNLMADQLERMKSRARALDAQMLAVQERERREVARDLHDEIGPCLLAANLDVAALRRLNRLNDRAAVEESAGGLAAVLAQMQDLVRRMIGRLHLDPTVTIDLAAAVDDLVAFWRDRCPEVVWATSLSVTGQSPPTAVSAALLKVAQEALANAVRHSGARRILTSLTADGTDLVLSISDDGAGMAESVPEGIGITGMRDRVAALNGTLSVVSAEGHGTTITARLRTAPSAAPPTPGLRVAEPA
jgi:two-component system sensor histidine kinase UhpB